MKFYTIMYPEDRRVSEEKVKGWFLDRVDNGKIILEGPIESYDSDAMAAALHDLGDMTFTDSGIKGSPK